MKTRFLLYSILFLLLSFSPSIALEWSSSTLTLYGDSGYYHYEINGGNDFSSSSIDDSSDYGDSGIARGEVTSYTNIRGYNSSTDNANDGYYTDTSQATGMAFDFVALGNGHVDFSVLFEADLYFNRNGNYYGSVTSDFRSGVKEWHVGNYTTDVDRWDGGASLGYWAQTGAIEDFSFGLEGLAPVNDHAIIDESYTYSFDVIEGTRYQIYISMSSIISNNLIGDDNTNPTAYSDIWNTIGFGDDGNQSFWEIVVSDVALESYDNPDLYYYNPNQNAPVPEPATILLLGTGLVGLVGASRRKFKK